MLQHSSILVVANKGLGVFLNTIKRINKKSYPKWLLFLCCNTSILMANVCLAKGMAQRPSYMSFLGMSIGVFPEETTI